MKNIKCPTCGRKLKGSDKNGDYQKTGHFPFCSERCRLIDLGSWLEGKYMIVPKDDCQP